MEEFIQKRFYEEVTRYNKEFINKGLSGELCTSWRNQTQPRESFPYDYETLSRRDNFIGEAKSNEYTIW